MKKALLLLLFPIITLGQINQIGTTINGENPEDNSFVTSLNSNGTIMAIAGFNYDTDVLTDVGYVRIFMFDGSDWIQLGNNIVGTQEAARFGRSISLSNDGFTIAIGSQFYSSDTTSIGQAQVYEYDGSDWVQVGQDINGENEGDQLGTSISLNANGSIMAVGLPGSDSGTGQARVYEYDGTEWIQLGMPFFGNAEFDFFGQSVKLNEDGDILVITSPTPLSTGSMSIFQYTTDNEWVQLGNDVFGNAGSLDLGISSDINAAGNIVAVGATRTNSLAGRALVFQFNGKDWAQMGQNIDGDTTGDSLGISVSLDSTGTILSVGTIGFDGDATDSGRTSLYRFNGNNWDLIGEIEGEGENDFSGRYLSLSDDGSIIAIGDISEDSSGNVQVFEFSKLLNTETVDIQNRLLFYPNPTYDVLYIESVENIKSISIYNFIGQKIDTISNTLGNKVQLNLSKYNTPAFLIDVETNVGVQTIKVLLR